MPEDDYELEDEPGDPNAVDTDDIAAVPGDQQTDTDPAPDNEDADDDYADVPDDGEILDFSGEA